MTYAVVSVKVPVVAGRKANWHGDNRIILQGIADLDTAVKTLTDLANQAAADSRTVQPPEYHNFGMMFKAVTQEHRFTVKIVEEALVYG